MAEINIRERRRLRRQELVQFIMNMVQGACIFLSGSYYFSIEIIGSYSSATIWERFSTIILGIFTFISFALWMAARVQLGLNLTFNPKAGEQLITKGLYGLFKHPIYYFGTITITLYILMLKRFWYLFFLLILLPIQFLRASREDAVLKKKFGDEFVQYRQRCLV